MPSIPSILALPKAHDLFDSQSQLRADWVARHAGRFVDELEWYAKALKAARTGGAVLSRGRGPDPEFSYLSNSNVSNRASFSSKTRMLRRPPWMAT